MLRSSQTKASRQYRATAQRRKSTGDARTIEERIRLKTNNGKDVEYGADGSP